MKKSSPNPICELSPIVDSSIAYLLEVYKAGSAGMTDEKSLRGLLESMAYTAYLEGKIAQSKADILISKAEKVNASSVVL